MKELASVSGNHFAKYDDSGNLVPAVEVVITTTEPVYRLSPEGAVIKRRDAYTIRLVTDPKSLRKLAEELIEQADAADRRMSVAMMFTEDAPETEVAP